VSRHPCEATVTNQAATYEEVRKTALRFLSAALGQLERERVIPRPRFNPYLLVGRDYHGPDLMSLGEFDALKSALTAAFPERFSRSVADPEYDAPDAYILTFVEACVTESTRRHEALRAESATVNTCLAELLKALEASEHEVSSCRLVSHLTTFDGSPLEIYNVTVIPVRTQLDVEEALETAIWGAGAIDLPFRFDPPQALIIARGQGSHPSDTAVQLSARIGRFLLLLRLLYAGTLESFYEVSGEARAVRHYAPVLSMLARSSFSHIRRTTKLSAVNGHSLAQLDILLGSVGVDNTETVVTSLAMAVSKFTESYLGAPWYDQLVDLSIALEAALSGEGRQDVGLRLRSRAAALLTAPNDAASDIFRDIAKLYDLRSTLVHGGRLTLKEAQRVIRGLSTFKAGFGPGAEAALAVDRLRDLARRAILARIVLATVDGNLWPAEGRKPVDEILADGEQRDRWRSAWREEIASIGAATAADPPVEAVEFLSQADQGVTTPW
jgi:Apea-like HEPN